MTLPDVFLGIAALACGAAWAHSVLTRRARARAIRHAVTVTISADASQAVAALDRLAADLAAVKPRTLAEADAALTRVMTDAPVDLASALRLLAWGFEYLHRVEARKGAERCLEGPLP